MYVCNNTINKSKLMHIVNYCNIASSKSNHSVPVVAEHDNYKQFLETGHTLSVKISLKNPPLVFCEVHLYRLNRVASKIRRYTFRIK